jgi:hypothetical protein
MLRHLSLLIPLVGAVPAWGHAQAHTAHHHPRGAKIIMIGTIVHPLCAFVQQVADSAQVHCAQQQRGATLPPVLVADGELYVLEFSPAAAPTVAASRALLGKHVKVDGTVYPAGNSYLVVVDSIRVASH